MDNCNLSQTICQETRGEVEASSWWIKVANSASVRRSPTTPSTLPQNLLGMHPRRGLSNLYWWRRTTASYCQKLVTVVSGGAFDQLLAVLEFDASDDLCELLRSVEATPFSPRSRPTIPKPSGAITMPSKSRAPNAPNPGSSASRPVSLSCGTVRARPPRRATCSPVKALLEELS